MGSQLIKGYSIEGDSMGQAGIGQHWKLFKGKKEQTKAAASIFLIQKKQLKKADKEEIIKLAKKEASQLLRVRHPGVLAVVEPLTEDDNILGFVTERVEGSLSMLASKGKLTQFIASELELKLYLYPFLETVGFIHDSLKQAHLTLSPQQIYLAPDGKWKLAGFGLNQLLTGQQNHQTHEKFYDYSHSAPELALSQAYTRKSDLFSIGSIIITLLQIIHNQYKPVEIKDRATYEKNVPQFKRLASHSIISKSKNPEELTQLIRGLVAWQGAARIGISEVLSSRWLNDSTLITVKYLDKISSYENKQQLEFLKGLAGVLFDFEQRVLTRIILPKLMDLLKFGHLIASIVYITVDLLKKERIPAQTFSKLIWPALRSVLAGKQLTAQAIYLTVLNYEVLEKQVGEPDTTTHLLPLYIKCFECPPKLKHLALAKLQQMSSKVDYQVFKTKIMPKLMNTLKDSSIDIRKDSLRGLLAVIKVVDPQTMSFSVLPALEACRKAGVDPFVNAIVNKIYKVLTVSLPVDVISNKILPNLIPYLSDPSINKTEFHQFKDTILAMINRVQKEREKTFQNQPVNPLEQSFTEADFTFKDDVTKPAQVQTKGNYNFLDNYIPKKVPEVAPELTKVAQSDPTNFGGLNFGNPTTSLPTQDFSFASTNMSSPNIQQAPTNDFNISSSNPTPSFNINNPAPTNDTNFNFNPQPAPVNSGLDFGQASTSNYQPLSFDFPETTSKPKTEVQPPAKQETQIKPKLRGPPAAEKKDSPKKQEAGKFIGGASGPMQLKKLVGPAQAKKPDPPQVATGASFEFDYLSNEPKKDNSGFNFEGMESFGVGASKPEPPKPQQPMSFDFGGGSGGISMGVGGNNDPFAELDQELKNKPQVVVTAKPDQNKPQPPPKTQPSKPKQESSDLYSYFAEAEDTPNTKAQDGGSGGMDDLI